MTNSQNTPPSNQKPDTEAPSPSERVMDVSWKLLEKLKGAGAGGGMLERYNYFCNHSERGRHCTYAIKSKAIFYNNEYNDIKSIVQELVETIRSHDDPNFCK